MTKIGPEKELSVEIIKVPYRDESESLQVFRKNPTFRREELSLAGSKRASATINN